MCVIIDNDIFIEKCLKKHGDKYDYSSMKYIKMKIKVLIKCKSHDLGFYQTPEKHLLSKNGGCPKCNHLGKGPISNKNFIEIANNIHDGKYDYSMVDYKKSNMKVKIICKDHGIFEIRPNHHLRGVGCSKCSRNYKYKPDEILLKLKEMYNDLYEYDLSNYMNIKSKIKVKCKKHSYFEISLDSILRGNGCSSCGKMSIGEERISKYLENRFTYIKQKSFEGCKYVNQMQFDFFIPDKNTCIEYDGKQHFKPIDYFGGVEAFESQQVKDSIKNDFCKENNIKLIRIPYYEYNNIEKILENKL
jgi:very-short-patch-repair endonuclease